MHALEKEIVEGAGEMGHDRLDIFSGVPASADMSKRSGLWENLDECRWYDRVARSVRSKKTYRDNMGFERSDRDI